LLPAGKIPKTTLITSALPGEGKTTTAVNTAISLAQAGARTLLIDLNLRNPRINEVFGVNADNGISIFLAGSSNLHSQLCQTGVENLFLLPAGEKKPNPSELVSSGRMDAALNILVQFFDTIVIDSPALLFHTDSLVLAGKVDEVILVVKGGETKSRAVKKAIDRLRRFEANVAGTVINGVDLRRPEYAYDYGQFS
jgi:capsular exopolysaccharide synthesis family protein